MLRCFRCGARTALALAALAVAPAASAGAVPASGIWQYDDNTPTLSTVRGDAVFQALVNFGPGERNFRSIQGVVTRGTCQTKAGATISDSLVDFSVNGHTKGVLSVKANGAFSGSLSSVTDTGAHGTVTVKGVLSARQVTGTVTVHNPRTAYGDCRDGEVISGRRGEGGRLEAASGAAQAAVAASISAVAAAANASTTAGRTAFPACRRSSASASRGDLACGRGGRWSSRRRRRRRR